MLNNYVLITFLLLFYHTIIMPAILTILQYLMFKIWYLSLKPIHQATISSHGRYALTLMGNGNINLYSIPSLSADVKKVLFNILNIWFGQWICISKFWAIYFNRSIFNLASWAYN